ncbi:MAG: P-II family nitrogen regulator [Candidatus Atribacteria bacterium]|nr:P-II family nitrogen regulator [Candidatus Atribacteria bacterium]
MAEVDIEFDLIVTIVDKGKAGYVVEASKRAGALGGTILLGRGSGTREGRKIFGIPIEPEKEIVLTLIDQQQSSKVLKAIQVELHLDEPGKGIAFALDVKHIVGIHHVYNLCNKDS